MRVYLFSLIFLLFLVTSCTYLFEGEEVELVKPLNSSELLPVVLIWDGTPPFDVFVDGKVVAEGVESTSLELDDLDVGHHTWRVRSERGWSGIGEFDVVEVESTVVVYVTSSTSGPAVEGALVRIKDSTLTTDESGIATLTFRTHRRFVGIEVTKDGYAWSGVEGLKIVPDGSRDYRVLLRKPFLSLENREKPLEIEAEIFDENGSPLSFNTVGSTFTVLATATSRFRVHYFYGALGKIPGANYMTGPRVLIENSPVFQATFTTEGFFGETEFHLVVYDYSDNRLDKIVYLNVVDTETEEATAPYVPEKKSLKAFTTPEEIIFYSADANSNTWVEITWVPWEKSEASGTTQRPKGYLIYRSINGGGYEKAGFVPSGYGTFRDHSPKIGPGIGISYRVCSIYSESEVHCTDFGSVEPLKPFRVELERPADMETEVSRDPTFVLKGNELHSEEGPTHYVYSLMILDDIFSNSYMVEATPVNGNLYLVLHDSTSSSFRAKFSSLNWYYYDPKNGSYRLYPSKELEANKTYEWGLIQAHAYVEDEDSTAYSIFVDRIFVGIPWRWTNRFTTGEE